MKKINKEVFPTSFVGFGHPHFCDGGDDGVVPVPFADQVDYPIDDLFNGTAVQAVILSRLETKKSRFKFQFENHHTSEREGSTFSQHVP